jgi:GTPase Era involved in 16S rRNA processing
MQGFTERDLANFRLPLRPISSKKGEQIAQLKEAVENTLPPAPTQAHTTQKVDAQTQSETYPLVGFGMRASAAGP